MDSEDIDAICGAIRSALSFQNADALEHVFGPNLAEGSLSLGVHRIADALERIAGALEENQ